MNNLFKIPFFLLFLVCAVSCSRPVYQAAYLLDPVQKCPVEKQSPTKPPPPFQQPFKGLVVIDAGHGGEDLGTHSTGSTKYQEKTFNLSTAYMVKNYLQQFGYEVYMTRKTDVFIPLDKRSQMANEQNPLAFVSIHYNSAPSPEAEGIEVYYYKKTEDKRRTQQSKALAQNVLTHVLKNTQAKSRGVKHGNYAVIRETKMPAILIEGGFLTNSTELKNLKNAEYLKKISLGIAQGVNDYLSIDLESAR